MLMGPAGAIVLRGFAHVELAAQAKVSPFMKKASEACKELSPLVCAVKSQPFPVPVASVIVTGKL